MIDPKSDIIEEPDTDDLVKDCGCPLDEECEHDEDDGDFDYYEDDDGS